MRRNVLRVVVVALVCSTLAMAAGCRSNETGDSVASAQRPGERASAFRDIGKRSASDLTLR